MKSIPLKIAKYILDRQEKKDQIERLSEVADAEIASKKRKELNDMIDKYAAEYIDSLIEGFKKSHAPRFQKGDEALLNWYSNNTYSWEGHWRQYLSSKNTSVGPLLVKLGEPYVETGNLEDTMDRMKDSGSIYEGMDYASFVNAVKYSNYYSPKVSWAYQCKIISKNIDQNLDNAIIRECHYLKPETEMAKIVMDLWKIEKKETKLAKKKQKTLTMLNLLKQDAQNTYL